MPDNREIASEMIAIFKEENGLLMFETIAPIDYKGNILYGHYAGVNVDLFSEITMSDSNLTLEDVTYGNSASVNVNGSSDIAFYRINSAILQANYIDGKFYSNFITPDLILKLSDKYIKNPADNKAKNNIYVVVYFKILKYLADIFKGIGILDDVASGLNGDEMDPVFIHELAECFNYRRPYAYTGLINNVFKFINDQIEPDKLMEVKTARELLKSVINEPKKEEKPKERSRIAEIIDEVSSKFVGQEEAVRGLALNIYYNANIIGKLDANKASRNKASILLDGSTGTGKTAIIKELADLMELPVVITGATQYSTVGYKGDDLVNILRELLISAKGDLTLAEKGVVFLDEFDKLAYNSDGKSDLVFKRGIQDELLKYIEGGIFQVEYDHKTYKFDTSKVTFICGGAFTDLRDSKIKKSKKDARPIGFSTPSKLEDNNTYELTNQDFIEYGIERELMGRLKTKISTKTYTKDDLIRIIKESTISPLNEFIDILKSSLPSGMRVYMDDDFIDTLADMAFELGTGARGLQEIMENVRTKLLDDIVLNRTDEICLTKSILTGIEEKKTRSY